VGNPYAANAGPYQQNNYGYPVPQGPNPSTAYLVELIGGLFGFFGIGYLYAGKTGDGIARLLAGIACNITVGISAAFTAGICACIALPVYIVLAILSAGAVKNMLLKQYQNP
jgi:TM2 domain-containing membrane protein YozV